MPLKNIKERRAYGRKHYQLNKTRINNARREYQKKYYKRWSEINKMKLKKYWQEYNKNHRLENNTRKKKWLENRNNRNKSKISLKRWKQSSKGEEWFKKYYTKPIIRLNNQRRQAIKRMGGELTIQTIQQVYEENIKQYGTLTCYLCLKPVILKDDSLEHKIPLFRGGTNVKENLNIAHKVCNSRKNTKTEEEYRREYV